MAHNVFNCWAGALSRSIGTVLHEWLPAVIQSADPFMSERDIDAGDRGLSEIAEQLAGIKVGLICVTADNQGAPWLNFEAGALSKVIETSRVIPLAFDLEKAQIRNPLGQFQAKSFVEEEMRQVVATINRSLGQPLIEARLDRAFALAWTDLSAKIEHLRTQESQQSLFEEPKRSPDEMLEELVEAAREQSNLLRGFTPRPTKSGILNTQIAAAETVLRRLGAFYGSGSPLNFRQLVDNALRYDREDWNLISTSPLLVFYLERFHNTVRPPNDVLDRRHFMSDQGQQEDEVPF